MVRSDDAQEHDTSDDNDQNKILGVMATAPRTKARGTDPSRHRDKVLSIDVRSIELLSIVGGSALNAELHS